MRPSARDRGARPGPHQPEPQRHRYEPGHRCDEGGKGRGHRGAPEDCQSATDQHEADPRAGQRRGGEGGGHEQSRHDAVDEHPCRGGGRGGIQGRDHERRDGEQPVGPQGEADPFDVGIRGEARGEHREHRGGAAGARREHGEHQCHPGRRQPVFQDPARQQEGHGARAEDQTPRQPEPGASEKDRRGWSARGVLADWRHHLSSRLCIASPQNGDVGRVRPPPGPQ